MDRSNKTPTLTTIDTYYHRIHDISFPAVTFCTNSFEIGDSLKGHSNNNKSTGILI